MATTLAEGVAIVNEALHDLGYEYQIDTTSSTTMTAGLEAIGAYPPSQRNAIMEQMNLVVQFRNFGVAFDASKNPFRRFLVDLTNGFGIEDIFHELTEGIDPLWDDKSDEANQAILTDLVSYDTNKIIKAFHTESADRSFKATIDKRNYDKVFTPAGLTSYIDAKLANLARSAEVWLMKKGVELVQSMVNDGKIVTYGTALDLNTKQGIANACELVKSVVDGFLTPCDLYNYGVYDKTAEEYKSIKNMTDSKDDIFIVTTPDKMERLKVQGYANAYNLSQFELEGRILYLPAGTDMGDLVVGESGEKEVLFVVLDRRALLLGIKTWQGGTFVVPNVANRVNQWLNVEILKGYNTFFNAVAFAGDFSPSVTDVNADILNEIEDVNVGIASMEDKLDDIYAKIPASGGGAETAVYACYKNRTIGSTVSLEIQFSRYDPAQQSTIEPKTVYFGSSGPTETDTVTLPSGAATATFTTGDCYITVDGVTVASKNADETPTSFTLPTTGYHVISIIEKS